MAVTYVARQSSARTAVRLAIRLGRSRIIRRLGLIPLVGAVAGIALFVSLTALDLSPDQVRQRDFGTFDAMAQLGDSAAGQPSPLATKARALLSERGLSSQTTLLSQVQPSDQTMRPLPLLEGNWGNAGWDSRYVLKAGSWPTRPGQTAVSTTLSKTFPVGTTVSVASGHGSLKVVAIIDDIFDQDGQQFMSAPGTFASFDWAALRASGSSLSATQTLWWHDNDPLATANALAKHGVQFDSVNTPGASPSHWIDRIPIWYKIPSVGLALGSCICAFGLARRHQRRRIQTLLAVGVLPRTSTTASALALAGAVFLSTLIGALLGVVAGLGVRAILAGRVDRPLSPFTVPLGAVGTWLLLTVVGCVVGSVALRVTSQPGVRRLRLPAGRKARIVSRGLIAVLALVAAVYAARTRQLVDATLLMAPLTVIAILLAPELVRGLSRWRVSATTEPRVRLIARHVDSEHWRPTVVLILSVIAIGPVILVPTLTRTILATENQQLASTAAPGQILVTGPNGGGGRPQQKLLDALAAAAPTTADQVKVYDLSKGSRAVSLDPQAGLIAAVASVDDAQDLANGHLTADQRTVLARGGVLTWNRDGDDHAIYIRDGLKQAKTKPIDVLNAPFQKSWEGLYSGLMLLPAANALELPHTWTTQVFTGLSITQASTMMQDLEARGLDTSSVYAYRPPVPYTLPVVFDVARIGVEAILLLVGIALANVQVRTLRRHGRSLHTLGIPRGWIGQVIGGEMLALFVAGAVLTILIVDTPVLAVASRIRGVRVSIPVLEIGVVAGLILIITAAAVWTGTHRIDTGTGTEE
ncbi:MAG: hypothetical protein QM638_04175 [Nocardioides sp.]|uniref:hypothetical protein n=1 Tax=Nocardioides sp. TaxID=35761 RepID=UPI0039E4B4C4